METLNNLQLSSTTKRFGTSQRELADRFLANEPGKNRPRPRNPLSKFTIASSNHSPSCQIPIPAYRTCAQENLPTLSPEDMQKMNISSVSGMPYCVSKREDTSSTDPSQDAWKTKRCLLQKKSIHRSLEDLRNISRKRNHPSGDLLSPRSRRSIPICSGEFSEKRHVRDQTDYWEGERKGNQNFSRLPSPPQQQKEKELNSPQIQSYNIINGKQIESGSRSGCGPGGDFAVSLSNKTNEKEDAEGALRNLAIENELLKRRIKEERRKCLFYRIVNAFTFEALRRRSQQLDQIEQSLVQRKEECAARIILHHLLLNSWRMTKGQVTAITAENAQMHKTIDNQSLQLNVIRKMQSIEKDKTGSVLKDYGEVKKSYCQTMKENETMKEKYAKVLEEKRSLERRLRSLSDDNSRLNTDLQIRLDKKEMQLRSMELDRFCAEKFSRENEQLAKEAHVARMQIKELTTQQAHWQEKAMSYESTCYSLKLEMESKEKAYERVLYEKRDISKENEILTLSKAKLEKAVEEAQVKLVENTAHKKQIESAYTECKEELEDLEDQVEYLQSALRQYKKENLEIRQKLYDCTLKNVKRRRVWGAALYFLVNPIEAFKRFYFGSPGEFHQSTQVTRLPVVETKTEGISATEEKICER